MITVAVVISILTFDVVYGRILLYNTENSPMVEKFDCVYFTNNDGDEITYCQRPGGTLILSRNKANCDNEGKQNYFRDLLDQGIEPNEVVKWNSSVEMADLYASIFLNRSLIENYRDGFICQCTRIGTFGKYCEYQLTHHTITFSEAVKAQFYQKKTGDSWDTQRYGDILCYTMLNCYAGPLCLDWREICDGVQRCWYGIDEENRDKLEFNECEDDEFRCTNGMCIAEEFWFDGDRDCMDWSDEYLVHDGDDCPFTPNAMECDEHLCRVHMFSCGDGQCIRWEPRLAFQRVWKAEGDCFTKRNLNYMCEVSPHRSAWTMKNGLCWPDGDYDDPRYPPWNMIHFSALTNMEKCHYLFLCILSRNMERDCPCHDHNCTQIMTRLCPELNGFISYPPDGLINTNMFVFYKYSEYDTNANVYSVGLFGYVKCAGYVSQAKSFIDLTRNPELLTSPLINQWICGWIDPSRIQRDYSSPFQYEKSCWNASSAFNGRPHAVNPHTCAVVGQCISQYRIHDGTMDCINNDDERVLFEKNYCKASVARHRFQCFDAQYKCLPMAFLGTGISECSNEYDESRYGTGIPIQLDLPCYKEQTVNCHHVKDYIQKSATTNASHNESFMNAQKPADRILFRSYCDSFWDSEAHVDEKSSFCRHWICQDDQYQCQTGQCIELDWLCDGEWDCTDASDEEAFLLIHEWSPHNRRLPNFSAQLEKCRAKYFRTPFSAICNTSFEFGCYRSRVSNPLDIRTNRPCINLTQIGNGVEDCYNAYDEKNTFTATSYVGGMWGFHFRCESDHKIYLDACNPSIQKNCTDLFCPKHHDKNQSCSEVKDFNCPENGHCKKNARCDGKFDCAHGEDEYWCPSTSVLNQIHYRFGKERSFKRCRRRISLFEYPIKINQKQSTKSITSSPHDELFKILSYQCNRGVAALQMNQTICLCPPAYYGSRCQFFSDRITVITRLDWKSLPDAISKSILKIRANFLFHTIIIDHHEFSIIPTFERTQVIKHKFYLLYSRSASMLAHKQNRYFNRTDIITHHPYSVHFDLFVLEQNQTVEELGSWYYPIHFDYLPAFRLASVLRFPLWLKNTTLHPCQTNSCNENSTCMPIFNQNHSHYCSCRSGYYGRKCSKYEPLCDTYCSSNAVCRPSGSEKTPSCICPLDRFGPRCYLRDAQCDLKSCLNSGTCFVSYDRSGEEPYICKCSERFYGNRCQHEKASVKVRFNTTGIRLADASVVQLYDFSFDTSTLLAQHQQVYHGLPSMINFYHSSTRAPELGVLKIYEDLFHPHYFLIYLLVQTEINITSSPTECPDASSLLSTDGEYIDQSVPAIFAYHHICVNHTQRLCFHDQQYFCLCRAKHQGAECFFQDTRLDHCDKCLSGGKCLQGDLNNVNDFICLCPSCHQGHRCEFNLEAFGFTLDSLVVDDSKQKKIFYTCIAGLLFIVGLFSNLSSFLTLRRPTPRKFGVGNYLLIVTALNQLVLFFLFFKFIAITLQSSTAESCQVVSYLLSVFTRSTYWLTSWITINRLLLIIFPTSSLPRSPPLAITISILMLIFLFAVHIHEILCYTSIQHLSSGSLICVTNFNTALVSTYNRISTLIHFLIPFFIQVISITWLIALIARSRAKTTGKRMPFTEVLKKQFRAQKELYVTPMIIIFSVLPQAILTFRFACTSLTDWQRHALLASYLLSYSPLALSFLLYILPSTSYRQEFRETSIGKNAFKWISKEAKTVIDDTKIKT